MPRNGGTMTTTRFDPATLVPSDLANLADGEFRQVVDADLRRRVNPDGLPARVSDALRDPKNVRRWHAQLVGIARSVEGQLVAAHDDCEAEVGTIEARIAQMESHRPDSPQLGVLRSQVASIRSEYLKRKASRERFKTGVDEHILIAEQLLAAERDEMFDSVVVSERDRLSRRVRYLERAIRDHRREIMKDMDPDEMPDDCDVALWAMLDDDDDD